MKSSIRAKKVLQKWSVMLILLAVTAVLSAASGPPKASAPAAKAPAAHAAPAHAAPAQHNNAPAQHAGGNAQRPGGASSNNRGPGGASSNNRGPGGNAANRGTTGANTHTQAGANRPGANGANHGGANASHPRREPVTGCGCQSQRCKRRQSWCGRRQCRPSSAGGQQERLSERWRIRHSS
jgi:hypothetical protein